MPRKCLNLYDESAVETWRNAKEAVAAEREDEPTQQEVLVELAEAYTGWSA